MGSRSPRKGEKGGTGGNCWFEDKSSPFIIPVMSESPRPLRSRCWRGSQQAGRLAGSSAVRDLLPRALCGAPGRWGLPVLQHSLS